MSNAGGHQCRVVLRRVHRRHSLPSFPVTIGIEAFRPNQNDVDGLSVFLSEEFGGISPEECARTGRGAPGDYLVVELREDELAKLGLTLVVDMNADAPKGHMFIPEVNWRDYSANLSAKTRLKELMALLAEIATRSIVFPSAS